MTLTRVGRLALSGAALWIAHPINGALAAQATEPRTCLPGEQSYQVVANDSLDRIARKFEISVVELLTSNNPLRPDSVLHPGDQLCIPRGSPAVSTTVSPSTPGVATSATSAPPPSVTTPPSVAHSAKGSGASTGKIVSVIALLLAAVGGAIGLGWWRRKSKGAEQASTYPEDLATPQSDRPDRPLVEAVVPARPGPLEVGSSSGLTSWQQEPSPANADVLNSTDSIGAEGPLTTDPLPADAPIVRLVAILPRPYDALAPRTAIVQTALVPGGFVRIDDLLVLWAVAQEADVPVPPGTTVVAVQPTRGAPN